MIFPLHALVIASQNAATSQDRDVIQAYIQWNTHHLAKDPQRPKTVLMTTPSGEIFGLCTSTLREHLAKYPALAEGFVAGLQRRAKTTADYSAFNWAKPIHLTTENRQALRMWDRLQKHRPYELEYRAELPAYSSDGKMAVLATWEGPNDIHTIRMVSLLKRTNTGWKVSWSLPAYYP